MGLFIVGLLTGFFLSVLLKDLWLRLQFYFLCGIAARKEKQERQQAIKDLEKYLNDED